MPVAWETPRIGSDEDHALIMLFATIACWQPGLSWQLGEQTIPRLLFAHVSSPTGGNHEYAAHET